MFGRGMGEIRTASNTRAPAFSSKFFRGREGQAAFAVEKFFQPLVTGACFTADDFWRDQIAQRAAMVPAFEPVFPTDGTFNRDAGDF